MNELIEVRSAEIRQTKFLATSEACKTIFILIYSRMKKRYSFTALDFIV